MKILAFFLVIIGAFVCYGSKMIVENIKFMRRFDDIRTEFYAVPQQGKVLTINKNKISLKGKSAIGATISSKAIRKII